MKSLDIDSAHNLGWISLTLVILTATCSAIPNNIAKRSEIFKGPIQPPAIENTFPDHWDAYGGLGPRNSLNCMNEHSSILDSSNRLGGYSCVLSDTLDPSFEVLYRCCSGVAAPVNRDRFLSFLYDQHRWHCLPNGSQCDTSYQPNSVKKANSTSNSNNALPPVAAGSSTTPRCTQTTIISTATNDTITMDGNCSVNPPRP